MDLDGTIYIVNIPRQDGVEFSIKPKFNYELIVDEGKLNQIIEKLIGQFTSETVVLNLCLAYANGFNDIFEGRATVK